MKMKIRTAFAAASLLALAACESTTDARPLPAVIQSCETNTAEVCGTWTASNGVYNAVWPQGSRAVIRVERFDRAGVVFEREDTPASSSAGMTAVYEGTVQADSVVNGVVTWTVNGSTFSGTWRARW